MEVTHLWVQILNTILVLLVTQPASSYTVQTPDFPVVSPDRLQFFEYEKVSVNCGREEDVNAWRVMRKLHKISQANISQDCSTPVPSCTIQHTFKRHSGEYWCENDKGERSRAVSISVTAGLVILDVPAQPVKEGSDVTLHCINKNTEKTHISDFYKDGKYIETFYKEGMTLSKVSKTDEGFYKCKISSAGESPESWLAIVKPGEEEGSDEETKPDLPLIFIISLVTFLSLLFLVIGLILCKKHKGGDSGNTPDDVTYAAVQIKKTGSKSSSTSQQYSSEQNSTYSVVAFKRGDLS
ncbi:uncharacterized protein LOC119782552 isoform X2 [Cyprinodon tularosa]|uniref:uncharacterized protein LOC119782552 isoform X2 n=1 Tax=Cyprinodon tularosa TaxID=77115 RepID=UPI0018E2776D|nr:uncharacterized protein LOC119782552 isoform X2 [Cyprinodon tularosa]